MRSIVKAVGLICILARDYSIVKIEILFRYTSLLVNKTYYDASDIMKNYDFTNCKELYDKMQGDRYDAIREDKRFIAVLDKIKEYC